MEIIEEKIDEASVLINGVPVSLPEDLYIPPDALSVILDNFQGPLDLLLYLIRKQNIDILNIPIALVANQYFQYIQLMDHFKLELAAEYLLMAAMLAEIKSKMLLPQLDNQTGEESDPRAELIRRLQEYEKFKIAAESLDQLPRVERDNFLPSQKHYGFDATKPEPIIQFDELISAFSQVLSRLNQRTSHQVFREPISVHARMTEILDKLQSTNFVTFDQLFNVDEGKMGAVVTFIALLELVRQHLVELIQTEPFQPLHIKASV